MHRMSSVLAIVSKALFEKMVPKKDVKLGVVVDTSQYVSSNKTFDGLKDGGAIFLVTVRPPDEKLWLVGVLESPKKKGDTWVAAANEAPLTDITAAIKKLEFASGTGLKAKKGALGMSLQTPRALTDDDVKVLRGMVSSKPASPKVHASEAYAKAVDEVVHHKKPHGKKKGGGAKLGKFRLENPRKPFDGTPDDLDDWAMAQLRIHFDKGVDITEYFGAEPDGDEIPDAVGTEVVDVVDTATGDVVYQVMVGPLGDGCVVDNQTTKIVVGIAQSGLDGYHKQPAAWVRDFGRACVEGRKRLAVKNLPFFNAEQLGEDDAADDED
jgi:hypothetical protein